MTSSANNDETIGPYRLLRELGRGGQGVVYLAQDTRLPRRIALKLYADPRMRGLLVVSDHSIKRFRREAEAASKLHHPGICAVYEAGEHEGVPYLAMQYVEGTPLSELIASARDARTNDDASGAEFLSSRDREGVLRIAGLVEAVARSLHVAHEAGLVHRDIKPANIMITDEQRPVILDFGLVHDDESAIRGLTMRGEVLGSPVYMAPEQLTTGKGPVDRRADIYALGVLLYECIALRPPFDSKSRAELYDSILVETPTALRDFARGVPRELERIVAVALDKVPERRYRTAIDLAEDLARLRRRRRVRGWAQRNPATAATAVVTFGLLSTGLGWAAHRNSQLAEGNTTLARTVVKLERSNDELIQLLRAAYADKDIDEGPEMIRAAVVAHGADVDSALVRDALSAQRPTGSPVNADPLQAFEGAFAKLEASYPAGHPQLASLRATHSLVLQQVATTELRDGRVDVAERVLLRAFELAADVDPNVRAATLKALVDLYGRTENPAEQARFQALLDDAATARDERK